MNNINLIESQILFEHTRFNVKRDLVKIDNILNEYIYLDKKDAVGIIPIVGDEIWLVDQYRHSVGTRLLEIPGGRIENNELPIQAAKRELKEETGLSALKMELFTTIFIHPSLCNEIVHIFIATEFSENYQELEKSEVDLKIKKIKIYELPKLLLSGQLPSSPDGYVLSLLMLKKYSKDDN